MLRFPNNAYVVKFYFMIKTGNMIFAVTLIMYHDIMISFVVFECLTRNARRDSVEVCAENS